jgi:hypothetical protein
VCLCVHVSCRLGFCGPALVGGSVFPLSTAGMCLLLAVDDSYDDRTLDLMRGGELLLTARAGIVYKGASVVCMPKQCAGGRVIRVPRLYSGQPDPQSHPCPPLPPLLSPFPSHCLSHLFLSSSVCVLCPLCLTTCLRLVVFLLPFHPFSLPITAHRPVVRVRRGSRRGAHLAPTCDHPLLFGTLQPSGVPRVSVRPVLRRLCTCSVLTVLLNVPFVLDLIG